MSIEQKLYVVALLPDEAELIHRLLTAHIDDLKYRVDKVDTVALRRKRKAKPGSLREALSKYDTAKGILMRMDPHIACGGADYVVADGERRLGKYAKAIALKALKL